MLCKKCNFKEAMMGDTSGICYDCWEFSEYNIYSGCVDDISDEILSKNTSCPIAYSDMNDVRQWHKDNGTPIIRYRVKKV